MANFALEGIGTALVTPFRDSAVDYAAYRTLLEMQVGGGVDFLVPLGTTAETPCLEDDEKVKLLEMTAEIAAGKPIVAGAGSNSLGQTLRNMRLLESHGADAFLIVVPYYNKPTQRGQYEYFKAVSEETDKPIVIYNVPGRTGANMTAETTLRLAEIPNIIAVKEASGNLGQIAAVIKSAPEGFSVLSGNDDQTLEIMRLGGAGIISVVSNLVPDMMYRFVQCVHTARTTGNWNLALETNAKLMPLFKGCFIESNPAPVKAGLYAMGLIANELRLPLVPCEPSTLAVMCDILKTLGIPVIHEN